MRWDLYIEQLTVLCGFLFSIGEHFVSPCVSGGGGGCGGTGNIIGCNRPYAAAAKTIPQQTTSELRGVMGGNIKTDTFVSDSAGEFVASDANLDCFGITSTICRWRNDPGDSLDWLRGSGSPNSLMSSNIVGTSISPTDPFLVLASTPRSPAEAGLLVSDPIQCQAADGELSYRHWLSRARNPGNEPKLRVCWRMQGETLLRDCQETTNPAPGPSFARIPGPIDRPFEIVIEGSSFTNQPEGGVILLDDIDYTASITPTCGGQSILERPFNPGGQISPNDFCRLDPFGQGAIDVGEKIGWQVTNGVTNRVNPLTGIHFDYKGSTGGTFAVADFPDPRQEAVNPDLQYVLETPTLKFSRPAYLRFERYMATAGTQMKVCKDDPNDFDCLWESPQLTRGTAMAKSNLQWRQEVIRLPIGRYKLYFVARYDGRGSFNKGQIGLSYLRLYEDPTTKKPLC